MDTKIHLSRTTKMDGIASWSLPALATCPGARDDSGAIVPVCQGCYAREGRYLWDTVNEPRYLNREGWKEAEWVNQMTGTINRMRHKFFRWFDSGDVYHPKLAEKILDVVISTPGTKHWLPTRSYKIPKIKEWLDQIDEQPNAVVRYSSDEVGVPLDTDHCASVVVPSPEDLPRGATLCTAYQHSPSRCNGCRACWDKSVKLVAYPAHGTKIQRVISSSRKLDAVA